MHESVNTVSLCLFCTSVSFLQCVRFYIYDSQLTGMCEVFWGIRINQHCDLWHFCVKIPRGEHRSRGLWDMVMFTFRVHTQTNSSALVALRNTGYANSLSLFLSLSLPLSLSLSVTHAHTHAQIFVLLQKN